MTLLFIYFVFKYKLSFNILSLLFLFADFDKLMKYKEYLLTTIVFYSLGFFLSLSSRFDNMWNISLNNYSSVERFWDLQLNLISMKCIFGNVDTIISSFHQHLKVLSIFCPVWSFVNKGSIHRRHWVGTIIFSFFAISSITYLLQGL